ncbi:MAG TPA: efflux RND transporter periplasmic adaptor subunit, partial [Candidatus Avacidaminococcus intestinavium]|nr:efflux RND transporter periplasmic adaptor subunit [Candidatus Avacidaminococcus intestinavium]
MDKVKASENVKKILAQVNTKVVVSILLAIGVFLVWYFWQGATDKTKEMDKVPLVKTIVIGNEKNDVNYSYPGEVRGRYEKELAFQVGGKIIAKNIQAGSVVQAGELLLAIDDKDVAQINNVSLAQLTAANSQLKLAESNLTRYQQLYAQNAISQAQLDQFENAYEVATATRAQALAQFEQSSNKLEYTHLVAEEAGIIAAVNAEIGQVVAAGQSVISFVQDGEREVVISVPENRLDELKSAKELEVTFWALPEVRVRGMVREIAPIASALTRTYTVKITLLEAPHDLKLGMTANVYLKNTGNSLTDAVQIPSTALFQNGEQPGVWVVKEGTAQLKIVKVLDTGSDYLMVQGLTTGERIISAGVHKIKSGQQVRLVD